MASIVVGGQSSIYPGYAVATSYLYSGIGTGTGAEVVLQLVPEPSALASLLAGSLAFYDIRRRRGGSDAAPA